ncbi:MAG: hypothetical protein WC985_11270 [Thermoplasmata archaeon]
MNSITEGNAQHDHVAQGEMAHRRTRASRFRWPVIYVISLATVVGSLFLLVPNGANLALPVLFIGLMALHHLPGLSHHGGHGSGHGQATKDADDGIAGGDPPQR